MCPLLQAKTYADAGYFARISVPSKCMLIRSRFGLAAAAPSRGNSTTSATTIARMTFSISVLIAWPVRSARFISHRTRRKPNFSKPKQIFSVCARTFHWPRRNSQLWRKDLPRTNNYSQSWRTSRRQQDRRRGNSRPDVWCNWKKCAAKKGRVSNSRGRGDLDRAPRSIRERVASNITHNAAQPSGLRASRVALGCSTPKRLCR
jgi:hypothetical protein